MATAASRTLDAQHQQARPEPFEMEVLDSFACTAPLRLRVTGVSLMVYAAGEIGGPLTRVADYDFGSDALRWNYGFFSSIFD